MYIEDACLCAECDWVFELDKFNRCPRCMSSQFFHLVDFFHRNTNKYEVQREVRFRDGV